MTGGVQAPRRIRVLRVAAAIGFATSGVLHFLRPEPFVRIVPPQLPAPELLVAVSGAAELAGAIGLLVPRTRRAAGIGLILLLVAVFPANVQMALDPQGAGRGVPAWASWARLPLQPLLGWWVWVVSRPAHRRPASRREQPGSTSWRGRR